MTRSLNEAIPDAFVILLSVPLRLPDPPEIDTNIVFFDCAATGLSAAELCQGLSAKGVRLGAMGPTRVRAVTHLDVTRAEVETAAGVLGEMLAGLAPAGRGRKAER